MSTRVSIQNTTIQKHILSYTLYYEVACPLCRQIRVLMEENELDYKIIQYKRYASKDANFDEFLSYNPTGLNPLICIKTNHYNDILPVYGMSNCINLVNIKQKSLLPLELEKKINTQNLVHFINTTFYNDVVLKIVYEKISKYLERRETPNTLSLGEPRRQLVKYLKMFTRLINANSKLACEAMTLADIALFSHLSVLDYINEIDWKDNPLIKEWYLVLKSRPAFRKILNDFIPGFAPSPTYRNLDF